MIRVLVKYRRANGVKISCFIDDGLGTDSGFQITNNRSLFVQDSLQKSGFVINVKKSEWNPTQVLTWLGNRDRIFHSFKFENLFSKSSLLHFST